MELKGTFNHYNADLISLDRPPAYAGSISHNASSSNKTHTAEIARQKKKAEEKKEREEGIDDLASLTEETIRQAYERFQETYSDAMEFYGDADSRLDDLETRINGQIQEIESETEQLSSQNGAAIYPDEQGGFYTVRDGERVTITDEDELESLRDQLRAIKASGQTVRTEEQSQHLDTLMLHLTDVMNARSDFNGDQQRMEAANQRAENGDPPTAEERQALEQSTSENRQKLEELEEKNAHLIAKGDELDHHQTTDQAHVTPTVSDWKASLPAQANSLPPAGI